MASYDSSYTALCSAVTLQSNKDGFFRQFADNITNLVDGKWLNDFVKLSGEKKILKCLNDKKIRNEILAVLDNVQEIYRGKSARLSLQRRVEAEHLYGCGKLQKSLLMYTQSVIRAPVAGMDTSCDDGITLALGLWGRSTVLFDLKRYQACLDDVKLALQEKLPEDLKLDAYWRMAECYVELNMNEQARISLNIMSKLIANDDESWNNKIQNKLAGLSVNKDNKPLVTVHDQTQNLTGGKHEHLGNASSKLQLTENKVAGKHFIAEEYINTGDTLLIEDPYVSCLSPEKYSSHCLNCFKRLDTGIPCPQCSAVAFCSLKCRLVAINGYHKYECRYLDLFIGSGMSVLCFAALRIVTQQKVKYFIEALENKDDCHSYNQVKSLVTHDDKRAGVDFLHRTLMALFLLAGLKKSKYFLHPTKMDSINPQEVLIGKILLRNLEVLQFNAHEIFEPVEFKNTNKPVKALNIGIALYRTASYFNHDCYPAVSRFFIGTKLYIKAVRPINKNETVGDNYGPVFTKHNLMERQKKLLSRYWFKCECCACLQNWPTIDTLSDVIFKLKCRNCHKLVVHQERDDEPVCKNCLYSCAELLEEVKRLKQKFETLQDDKFESDLTVLCDLQDSLADILYPPHKIFNEMQETIIQFWMRQGNVFSLS